MTKEEFRKLTENILILDGATGSNLMASGMRAASVPRPGLLTIRMSSRISSVPISRLEARSSMLRLLAETV
mgnify:CR=1 FL=1